jgi:hypothetical protein
VKTGLARNCGCAPMIRVLHTGWRIEAQRRRKSGEALALLPGLCCPAREEGSTARVACMCFGAKQSNCRFLPSPGSAVALLSEGAMCYVRHRNQVYREARRTTCYQASIKLTREPRDFRRSVFVCQGSQSSHAILQSKMEPKLVLSPAVVVHDTVRAVIEPLSEDRRRPATNLV